MAKRPSISSAPQSLSNTVTINSNFEAIKEAFDNTLSRDGSTPNQMNADIDLNGNDLLNVGRVLVNGEDYVALVEGLVEDVSDARDEAEASAESAAESAAAAALYADLVTGDAAVTFTGGHNNPLVLPIPASRVLVFANTVKVPDSYHSMSEDGLSVVPASGYYWPSGDAGNIEVYVRSASTNEDIQDIADAVSAVQPYTSLAALNAATVAAPIVRVFVRAAGGVLLAFAMAASTVGAAQTSNGGTVGWNPEGDVTPLHYAENTTPGTTNLTTAMQAAADYLVSLGGGPIVLDPRGGPYYWGTVDLTGGAHIEGNGSSVIVPFSATATYMIKVSALSVGADIALTANAVAGGSTVQIADTTGWAAGDYFRLTDDDAYNVLDSSYRNGETLRVKEVTSGTVLTVEGVILGTIDGGDYTTANSAKIEKVEVSPASHVRNLAFVGDWDSKCRLVEFSGTLGSTVSGCFVKDHGTGAFYTRGALYTRFYDNFVDGLRNDLSNGFAGYAFVAGGADFGMEMYNNVTTRCRHGFTTVGGGTGFPRGFKVRFNIDTYSTGASYDTHACGSHYEICDNTSLFSLGSGITARSPHGAIKRNTIRKAAVHGINFGELHLHHMEVEDNYGEDIGNTGFDCDVACPYLTLRRNTFRRIGKRGIVLFSNAGALDASPGLVMEDNIVDDPSLTDTVEGIRTGGGYTNTDAIMQRNKVFQRTGTPTYAFRFFGLTTSDIHDNEAIGTFSSSPAISGLGGNRASGNRTGGAVDALAAATLTATTSIAGPSILSSSRLGFSTSAGAGSTVTQATSKTTGVTINKATGTITTDSASMLDGETVIFTVTNSFCTLQSSVSFSVRGTGNFSRYSVEIGGIVEGAFQIKITNTSGGSRSDAISINFGVIQGSTT